jgi:GntR family transcriptional regulator, transcriptional repressor for pyruvate dehydrogenase complex
MAERLQVSRNALREALKALEAIGLVEVRMGAGTFVAAFDPVKYMDSFTHSLMVEGMNLNEMWEVRKALELAFVGRACECIGQEGLLALEESLAQQEEEIANRVFSMLSSLRMHPIVYRCLANRFLNGFLESYVEFVSRWWPAVLEPDTAEEMLYSLEIHRDLVVALRRRDAEAARQALERDFGKVDIRLQFASRYNSGKGRLH